MLRALAAPLAVLTVLALAGCGGSSEPAATPATEPSAGQAAGPAPAAPPEGSPVTGTTLDGETVSLADFRGKPVLVNVWSSW